ncbi:beta strand repeat-containing protein [Novosphingobium aquiterrae]|uniref:Beta strand repeat-containing protein n=1 Tax=Novosphingobium aquiterrae TaxID=624388 RepID=A0ABV6PFV5_9SPHN
MGDIPGAGGTTTSFANTPQAKDDSYVFIEDILVQNALLYNTSTRVISLDVMANDLGGKAKSLFSIDDGLGNQITDLSQTDLLTNQTYSNWQTTAQGNQIRIVNGIVEYRLIDRLTGQVGDVNTLNAGQLLTDSFSYAIKLGNGTLSWARVNISLTGSNDLATISGTSSGAVIEAGGVGNAIVGTPTTGGTLAVNDVDAGQATFAAPSGSLNGTYGNFTFNTATGVWGYTLDNARFATQALAAGEVRTDSLTVTSLDGSASRTITVHITGTNDAPVITSAAQEGTVKEDTTLSVTGTVTSSDVDHGATASYSASGASAYGSFVVDPSTGAWTYTLDNAAHQNLAQGESHDEVFTVTVTDDKGATATQIVTITVTGTNDAPVITSGVQSGSVQEDGQLTATGQVTSSDVDNGATATYSGTTTGTYGSFAVTAAGAWTYTLDNAAHQNLAQGESHDEVFTVTVTDDKGATATQIVTITVTGTNDAPDLRAVTTDTITSLQTETNAALTASGTLTVTDSDTTDTIASSVTSVTLGGTTGSLTSAAVLGMLLVAPPAGLAANSGDTHNLSWTFNSGSQAFNYLGTGQSLTLTYTVTSSDGHGGTDTQNITVNINGTNDAAVISGTSSGSVIEAGTSNGGGTPTATGTLTDTDVDNPANTFTASSGSATYGSFTMSAGGVWTYTLNNGNAAVNALITGQTLNDSFTVTTVDGTQQTVSVTINGASDNNPPIVANDTIWVSNSTTVTLPPAALLANDVDVDGISLSLTNIVVASGTLASPVTINADGSFTFTTGATGGTVGAPSVVTLTYTTSDGAGGTSTGTATVNIVNTTGGADTINLTGVGTYQASYINGGAGVDIITDGSAISVLNGGAGADTLTGNSGDDLLVGGDQNDTLSGGAGNDILRGGLGNNDTMDGGAGSEDLLDFSDATLGVTFTLVQSAASTSITNGTGGLGNNDTYQNIEGVIGTSLNDSITGSSGNDILRGGGGNDTLNGAGGTDLIDFTDGTSGINFTIVQSAGTTVVNLASAGLGTDTYSNFEGVIGTAFADTLTGSNSHDELRGGSGNDTISGLGGNDRIIGGDGADILTGGLGNDTFVFSSALNGFDTITDFSANATDKIELDDATFTALIAGSLNSANFVANSGGNAVDANDFILFDTATGDLFYDADGSGAAAKILFAHIDLGGLIGGAPALDATDFIIV